MLTLVCATGSELTALPAYGDRLSVEVDAAPPVDLNRVSE